MNPPPIKVDSIEEAQRLRAETDARIQAALARRDEEGSGEDHRQGHTPDVPHERE
jgi:hypothetical protein